MSVNTQTILNRLQDVLDPVEGPSIMHRPIGDGDLNGGFEPDGRPLKPAAVLALMVPREDGLKIMFTRRADHLQAHAGQVSFPGGRHMAGRETLAECALRETREEVGLDPDQITLLGRWEQYETGTGYTVTPFAGVIEPGFEVCPDPGEVAEVFETPFDFLMDKKNHRLEEVEYRGMLRRFYAMPHQGRYIWGATAGMLRALSIRYVTGRPVPV